jgi:hypothetical protein
VAVLEIDHLHRRGERALGRVRQGWHQQVRAGQVGMGDVASLHLGQGRGQRTGQGQAFLARQRPPLAQHLGPGRPGDPGHHDGVDQIGHPAQHVPVALRVEHGAVRGGQAGDLAQRR